MDYESWLIKSFPIIYAQIVFESETDGDYYDYDEEKSKFIYKVLRRYRDIFLQIKHILYKDKYKNKKILNTLKKMFKKLYNDSLKDFDGDLFYFYYEIDDYLTPEDIGYLLRLIEMARVRYENFEDSLSQLSLGSSEIEELMRYFHL